MKENALDRLQRQFESAADRFPHFRCGLAKGGPGTLYSIVQQTFGPNAGFDRDFREANSIWFYKKGKIPWSSYGMKHVRDVDREAHKTSVADAYQLFLELSDRATSLVGLELETDWERELFRAAEAGELVGVEVRFVLPMKALIEQEHRKRFANTPRDDKSVAKDVKEEPYLKVASDLESGIVEDDYLQVLSVDPFTASAAMIDALRNDSGKPTWSRDQRKLMLDEVELKKVRSLRVAKNVVLVLDTFQEDGWPFRIDSPLPDDSKTLHETIESLNKNLTSIRFRSDGDGEGITWERC